MNAETAEMGGPATLRPIDVRNREGAQAWDAQLELMATIAHDMRGPLSTIATSAELLEEEIEVADSTYLVGAIQRQAKRLQQMIQQLADYAHLESGEVVVHPSSVDMVDLVRETAADFQKFVPSHTVQVELPAQQVLVNADSDGIRRVLDNLLGNAAKYSPQGGTILIRLRRRRRGRSVLIEVEDEGPGIERSLRRDVFQPFVRLDRATMGQGLGLYIVACLVKAHLGRVWVTEAPGGGARFCVMLPSRRRSE
jgi:signal transduction histidine kinase